MASWQRMTPLARASARSSGRGCCSRDSRSWRRRQEEQVSQRDSLHPVPSSTTVLGQEREVGGCVHRPEGRKGQEVHAGSGLCLPTSLCSAHLAKLGHELLLVQSLRKRPRSHNGLRRGRAWGAGRTGIALPRGGLWRQFPQSHTSTASSCGIFHGKGQDPERLKPQATGVLRLVTERQTLTRAALRG